MRLPILIAVLVFSQLPHAAHAKTRKFAVVIGNNQGHEPDRTLRFAEQDAKKFYKVLTELGGVAAGDIALVLGADAEAAWSAVRRMEGRVARLAKDDSERSLLIFYYSGHAEGDLLELNDSSLRMGELLSYLRHSSADVRLAFLDSCRSGQLVTMKGGRRGPEFDILVTDEIASKGYAIVTSSADNELSQESAEIHGAYFTHYLVSALRGAGDRTRDGKVTLVEAYDYAYARTLARTSVTVGGSQHPMYEFQLEGRGDLVLTKTGKTASGLTVTLPESGRLIVMDEERQTIISETELQAGSPARLALPAGPFHVYLIAKGGAVRAAEVSVPSGREASLGVDDFKSVFLEDAVEKGGLFPEETRLTHLVFAAGVWRLWALEGAVTSYGATLGYRLISSAGWQPTARVTWTTRGDVGLSMGYHDLGVLCGMGYVYSVDVIRLRAELLVGYEHLFQEPYEGQKRHTSGFAYLGVMGLGLPAGRLEISLDAGVGGRTFQVIDKGWVHRLDFQAVLGLGWTWTP